MAIKTRFPELVERIASEAEALIRGRLAGMVS